VEATKKLIFKNWLETLRIDNISRHKYKHFRKTFIKTGPVEIAWRLDAVSAEWTPIRYAYIGRKFRFFFLFKLNEDEINANA